MNQITGNKSSKLRTNPVIEDFRTESFALDHRTQIIKFMCDHCPHNDIPLQTRHLGVWDRLRLTCRSCPQTANHIEQKQKWQCKRERLILY